jgi:hypothetical protein
LSRFFSSKNLGHNKSINSATGATSSSFQERNVKEPGKTVRIETTPTIIKSEKLYFFLQCRTTLFEIHYSIMVNSQIYDEHLGC